MEQYQYFCTISKHLYQQLESLSLACFALSRMGLFSEELEERRIELLQKIEEHLEGFELAMFDHELQEKL
ncbi:hypothetical protein [Sphingobacterium kyonggiense]